MDQRELHLQHVGICYKLYNFIMKTLAAQALKTVTLGRPSHYRSSSIGSSNRADKMVQPATPCESHHHDDKELPTTQGLFGDYNSPLTEHKNNPCRNIVDENEVVGENMMASLPQAPKKMVSINDNVEEIILPSKKRRSKSFQKSNSMDPEEHAKPLRSILKVGSNLDDKSNSICIVDVMKQQATSQCDGST